MGIFIAIRKLAYAIYRLFFSCEIENFIEKSMVWIKDKKNRYTPAYPRFTI